MQWGVYPSEKHKADAERQAAWRIKNVERRREYTRRWRAKNLIALREHQRKTKAEWMTNPENRVRHALGQAKRRALIAGMEFSITIKDVSPLPTHCPVFGTPINYGGTGNRRGFVNNSPSVDRIDPLKGYIKGNVRVISWRANRIKADATLDELRKLLSYLESHQ